MEIQDYKEIIFELKSKIKILEDKVYHLMHVNDKTVLSLMDTLEQRRKDTKADKKFLFETILDLVSKNNALAEENKRLKGE